MTEAHTYLITHSHTSRRMDVQRPTVTVRASSPEEARAKRRNDILDHAERRRIAPGSAEVGLALVFNVEHYERCACQSPSQITADDLYR